MQAASENALRIRLSLGRNGACLCMFASFDKNNYACLHCLHLGKREPERDAGEKQNTKRK